MIEKYDTKVILYIRKQDEFYNSPVNQWTKAKELVGNNCVVSVYENYFLVNKIFNNVKGNSLEIRVYEREQLVNNYVICDFLYAIDILDKNDIGKLECFNF